MEPPVVVGVMSGTSLDGISAATVRFHETESASEIAPEVASDITLRAELLGFVQHAYTPAQRERLERAMEGGTAAEYCRLSADLGSWFGEAACAAMAAAGLRSPEVAAIASHGQTLWHEPPHSTWQAGDAARIAEITGCAVVSDFRTRDMAVGGQGAPLVPIADRLLFSAQQAWRALQNIGGIGNVSVVPPRNAGDDPVLAFDTGPGVVVMNGVMRRLTGAPFDRDGAMAAAGRTIDLVIDAVLADPFFAAHPPKSTGRELFTPTFIDEFVTSCRTHGASDADVIATATGLTARTIAEQYARFLPSVSEVVLSGGGARNTTLVQAIRQALRARLSSAMHVVLFDDLFFDAEAKEAVAFALLGYLHLIGRPGNVPSATGARSPRVLGAYTPAALTS